MSNVATIVTGTPLAVHSPYSREWAYTARMSGGTWDRSEKVWKFGNGHTAESLRLMCARYYPEVVIAATLPLPLPEVPTVDHGIVGVVGQTLTVALTVTRVYDTYGAYGQTRIHTMADATGHVFVWFASTARYNVGDAITLQGKIKKHDTYKGISQTHLTRCKKV